MRWTKQGVHLLFQTRTQTLNSELWDTFRRWYPGMAETEDASISVINATVTLTSSVPPVLISLALLTRIRRFYLWWTMNFSWKRFLLSIIESWIAYSHHFRLNFSTKVLALTGVINSEFTLLIQQPHLRVTPDFRQVSSLVACSTIGLNQTSNWTIIPRYGCSIKQLAIWQVKFKAL